VRFGFDDEGLEGGGKMVLEASADKRRHEMEEN
jgi:hypothetical protein